MDESYIHNVETSTRPIFCLYKLEKKQKMLILGYRASDQWLLMRKKEKRCQNSFQDLKDAAVHLLCANSDRVLPSEACAFLPAYVNKKHALDCLTHTIC